MDLASETSPLSEVVHRELLVSKSSAVSATGALRTELIDGVVFRPTRPVPHDDGTLAEIARVDWDEITDPIVHTHLTTTEPGRVRGWGLHQGSTDRLFVVKGLVSIVVYDGRVGSRTFGAVNEVKVSERNPGLLIVPPNLYHGWKVIGTEEAFIINMPTSPYSYENPDALDLPYESELAPTVVPWRW
ncbi:MAG TPA: dTDP-4-dehydrorhamnose 3,5-epimerase family protein [Acidimicrobiales bacterium]